MHGDRTRSGTAAGRISTAMVRLLSRYTGRGPTRARTTVNTNLVVVVFQETLTKAERNLVDAGEADAVHRMRRTFRSMMREQAIEAVAAETGRDVVGFMSDVDTEADAAGLIFLLDPLPETGRVQVDERIHD